jgi:hypothetical protein
MSVNVKNHTELIEQVWANLKAFRNNLIDSTELIVYLKAIETDLKATYKYPKDKGIWFRFFGNDTGATTLNDIQRDLSLYPTHKNYTYMIQCFDIAIIKPSDIQIYLS